MHTVTAPDDEPGSGGRPPQSRLRFGRSCSSVAGLLLLLAGMAAATRSVPRYEARIVFTYVVLAISLAVALGFRRASGPAGRGACGVALISAGVVTYLVPAFSYLSGRPAVLVRDGVASCAVLAGVLLFQRRRHAADLALALSAVGYLIMAAMVIHYDPAPHIDVWYILQDAADGLPRGHNMYTATLTGTPGTREFTYLPWTAVLLAPGRWLAGDVRWTLVALTLLTVGMIRFAGRRQAGEEGAVSAGICCLVVLLPGTSTQVEQAWTEPLLFALLTGMTLAILRGRLVVAVLLLGLGLAAKQHLWLLLPVLAAWPRFGLRRTASAAAVAGILTAPWIAADPAAIWHDTVTLLVNFHVIQFADTLYLFAVHDLHRTPPFWLTGAVVAATLIAVSATVHHRNPPPAELVRWCALLLFVANVVNKQAFYNQYWLVAALVLLSWALPLCSADGLTGEQSLQPDDEPIPAPRPSYPLPAAST